MTEAGFNPGADSVGLMESDQVFRSACGGGETRRRHQRAKLQNG